MPAIFTTKTDGNYLLSTTGALANQSTYGYNINTGELNRGQENRPLVPSRYNAINGFAVKWDLDPGDGYYDSRVVYFAVGK